MDQLQTIILQVEQRYADRFYSFCKALFSHHHIPSHNHNHHLRVWGYAKQLYTHAWQECGLNISVSKVEALLAACLFHDTGLTRNIGEQHGAEGATIFAEYMAANPDIRLSLYDEIIEAITLHDDKRVRTATDVFGTTALLSTCDDLDAFGELGAYRYAEIYLMRGMPTEQIPHAVIANLDSRFANLTERYAMLQDFCSEQEKRYLQARTIYVDKQLVKTLLQNVQLELDRIDLFGKCSI